MWIKAERLEACKAQAAGALLRVTISNLLDGEDRLAVRAQAVDHTRMK
jgi:hypothetical protein